MAKELIKTEVYKNIDGQTVLVDSYEVEIDVPTVEEQIAEKEAKLLEMYAELQALKEK